MLVLSACVTAIYSNMENSVNTSSGKLFHRPSNLVKRRTDIIIWSCVSNWNVTVFRCIVLLLYYGTFWEVTEASGSWVSLLIKEMALSCLLEYTYNIILLNKWYWHCVFSSSTLPLPVAPKRTLHRLLLCIYFNR